MLEINNFSKIYKGNKRAVDTISLEVKKYLHLLVIMEQVKLQL